jgi:hypothetical protein
MSSSLPCLAGRTAARDRCGLDARTLRADRKPDPARRAARRAGQAEVPPLGQRRHRGRIRRLADAALGIDDPPAQPGLSADPGDDYLVTLARAGNADYLVSGDRHLFDLADPNPPVLTPRQFLERLTEASGT